MRKENSVGVIYRCKRSSSKLISNREKLLRRLQRAIEDMAEDGLKNFVLPLKESNSFATSFVDAFLAERAKNKELSLTILLEYEAEDSFEKAPAQRLIAYTQYADEVIYNKRELFCEEIDKTLSLCTSLIIYYEGFFGQLNYIIQKCPRFININL